MQTATYIPGDILKETYKEIRNILKNSLDYIKIERIVVGIFFTGVKLSFNASGICFTPIKAIPEAVCCPSSALAMPDSGKIKNRKITDFLDELLSGNSLGKAIGIAALNALSELCWREKDFLSYGIRTGIDPLDEISFSDDAFVVVVGALVPALKILKQRGKPFGILELDPSVLKKDEMKYFTPFERASEIVPKADILIITGTTLINDTLEGILNLKKDGANVIVVGPTASMLPDALFRRNVRTIGGVYVNDADKVLDVLAEAGSGYDFFGNGADKFTISSNHL
jgi:uncharacterized protein